MGVLLRCFGFLGGRSESVQRQRDDEFDDGGGEFDDDGDGNDDECGVSERGQLWLEVLWLRVLWLRVLCRQQRPFGVPESATQGIGP